MIDITSLTFIQINIPLSINWTQIGNAAQQNYRFNCFGCWILANWEQTLADLFAMQFIQWTNFINNQINLKHDGESIWNIEYFQQYSRHLNHFADFTQFAKIVCLQLNDCKSLKLIKQLCNDVDKCVRVISIILIFCGMPWKTSEKKKVPDKQYRIGAILIILHISVAEMIHIFID